MASRINSKRNIALALLTCLALVASSSAQAADKGKQARDRSDEPRHERVQKGERVRISDRVRERAERNRDDMVRVIVTYKERPDASDDDHITRGQGRFNRRFKILNGHAVTIPARRLERLMNNPRIESVVIDEPMNATVASVGEPSNISLQSTPTGISTPGYSYATTPTFSFPVLEKLHRNGIDGSGVGVAVIDSGFTAHADVNAAMKLSFIEYDSDPDDAYGHGNHVAGIIAGRGLVAEDEDEYASGDAHEYDYRGIAPGARIYSLRTMDHQGGGFTSDVIAALEWVKNNHAAYNIRVVNLSLGHPVYDSASSDPLVQAVEALWNDGYLWNDDTDIDE